MPSIILLSSSGNALIDPLLDSLKTNKIVCKAVIIDGSMSSKNLRIQRSRLDSSFEIKNLVYLDFPNVPFYFVKNHNYEDCINLINSLSSDYLINAGTSRILKEHFLNNVTDIINCHPGILPFYCGCAAVE